MTPTPRLLYWGHALAEEITYLRWVQKIERVGIGRHLGGQ